MFNSIKRVFGIVSNFSLKLYISAIITFLLPISCFADGTVNTSGDIFTYLSSLLTNLDKAKMFFWILAGAVGAIGAAYGFIMLMVINTNADYRGKVTKSHCMKMLIVGIIVSSASVYFTMIANTIGATDAKANATSATFTGFDD